MTDLDDDQMCDLKGHDDALHRDQERQEFHIDSEGAANWYLRKQANIAAEISRVQAQATGLHLRRSLSTRSRPMIRARFSDVLTGARRDTRRKAFDVAHWRTPFELLLRSDPAVWTAPQLEAMSVTELRHLARLLGVSASGSRAVLVSRLLDRAALRSILATFETLDDLVSHFKGRELRDMARRAGCFLGVNKRSSAASLLNWRNKCRTHGQRYYRETVRILVRADPVTGQIRLPLDD